MTTRQPAGSNRLDFFNENAREVKALAATTSRANSKDERMLTQTTKASKSRLTPRDRVRLRRATIEAQRRMQRTNPHKADLQHISHVLHELLIVCGIDSMEGERE